MEGSIFHIHTMQLEIFLHYDFSILRSRENCGGVGNKHQEIPKLIFLLV
jgi:hypothetical protein